MQILRNLGSEEMSNMVLSQSCRQIWNEEHTNSASGFVPWTVTAQSNGFSKERRTKTVINQNSFTLIFQQFIYLSKIH